MKKEVGTPVIIAVIVIALLLVGGIAMSVFGKKGASSGGTAADHAKWVQEHPESSMNKPGPNPADYKRGMGGSPVSGGQPTSSGR